MSEWKWQEGRKEGWWSIPDYAEEGEGKGKDCGRAMDGGAERPAVGTDSRGMLHEGHRSCRSHCCLMVCVLSYKMSLMGRVASPPYEQMKSQ